MVTTYWFISALNLVTNGKMGQNLANRYQEIVPSDKWWKVVKAALTGPCFFQFKCNYLHSWWHGGKESKNERNQMSVLGQRAETAQPGYSSGSIHTDKPLLDRTACLRCVFRGDTFGLWGDSRSQYEGTLPVSHWMVKVVMWSPAAGLHHCNDLVNTKGGLFTNTRNTNAHGAILIMLLGDRVKLLRDFSGDFPQFFHFVC